MGITSSAADLAEPLFSSGQLLDSKTLGDTGNTVNNAFVPNWDPGFLQQLDGVILYTAETKETLQEKINEVDKVLHGSYKIVTSLFCNVRPGAEAGNEQ
jgi:hypothetical protein